MNQEEINKETLKELFEAIENNNIEKVKNLVENGADINAKYADFNIKYYSKTALIIALEKENLEMVKYLVEHGADVNFKYYDKSALMVASEKWNLDIVKYLVEKGADVNTKYGYQYESLYGDRWMKKIALIIISKSGHDKITALEMALNSGNLDLVKYLIEKLENNNDIDEEFIINYLTYALSSNNLELIKNLENKGWDTLIVKYNLVSACRRGNLELVKYLVEHGADINHISYFQETALMFASHKDNKDNLEVVKYLVEKGADINARDRFGHTALMRASRLRNLKVVKYLVGKGAIVNIKDRTGLSDLGFGEIEELVKINIMKIFINKGSVE